ncbi:glutamate-cysteine ligase family protein [Streptomyces sp. NPDC005533]|uniref:carboxylate-amine ligase n=1 Tax=Streptomyces sp. NPDC005533 TaxID=3364723 RepID=UPI003692DD18
MATVGVEEEFFLIDPHTRLVVPAGPAVAARAAGRVGVATEFALCQVEGRTPPCRSGAELRGHLERVRAALGGAGRAVSALQVHVHLPDRELAVWTVNRLRPWLPLLIAVSANPPFRRGMDTGYAGYRTVLRSRFPCLGPPPYARTLQKHERLAAAISDSEAMSASWTSSPMCRTRSRGPCCCGPWSPRWPAGHPDTVQARRGKRRCYGPHAGAPPAPDGRAPASTLPPAATGPPTTSPPTRGWVRVCGRGLGPRAAPRRRGGSTVKRTDIADVSGTRSATGERYAVAGFRKLIEQRTHHAPDRIDLTAGRLPGTWRATPRRRAGMRVGRQPGGCRPTPTPPERRSSQGVESQRRFDRLP